MKKPLELIYSQQSGGFVDGRAYSNPRFFSTPREGVEKVYLVGDWPKIRAAYEALGVPVEQLDADAAQARDAAPQAAVEILVPALTGEERDRFYIPDDWRDLPWTRPEGGRDLTLRGLGAMFASEPVINKSHAVAAIEAELARRAGAEGILVEAGPEVVATADETVPTDAE